MECGSLWSWASKIKGSQLKLIRNSEQYWLSQSLRQYKYQSLLHRSLKCTLAVMSSRMYYKSQFQSMGKQHRAGSNGQVPKQVLNFGEVFQATCLLFGRRPKCQVRLELTLILLKMTKSVSSLRFFIILKIFSTHSYLPWSAAFVELIVAESITKSIKNLFFAVCKTLTWPGHVLLCQA